MTKVKIIHNGNICTFEHFFIYNLIFIIINFIEGFADNQTVDLIEYTFIHKEIEHCFKHFR